MRSFFHMSFPLSAVLPSLGSPVPPSVHYPTVRLSIHLSLRPSVHPTLHPSIYLFVRPSAYPSVALFVHPSVRAPFRTSICPPFRASVPSIDSSICLFVRPTLCPSVHSSIRLFVPSFVRHPFIPFIYSSVRPPIHPSVNLFVSRVSIDLSICLPIYWSIDVFSFFSYVFLLFLKPGCGLLPRPSESVVAVLQQLWGWWRNTLTSNSCAHRFVHSLLSRFKVGISLSTTAEEHASEYMILLT